MTRTPEPFTPKTYGIDFLPQGFIKHGSEAYVTKTLDREFRGRTTVWVAQYIVSDLELFGEQTGGLPVLQCVSQGAVIEDFRRGVPDLKHQPADGATVSVGAIIARAESGFAGAGQGSQRAIDDADDLAEGDRIGGLG